ncbi:glycosyltransferase family 2 protein [Pseudoclavibacter helvolus]|uniref:glycosyltransferase family 2 protein n=1 Tax=Pseudoclavibacter helvolus TaxID=255205 RepID=UPI003C77D9CA
MTNEGIRTALITIVHGRHAHLGAQRAGLLRQTHPADDSIVVAMGDPAVSLLVDEDALDTEVIELPADPSALPLAAARNAGARRALERGAELLVFLDVDCIPGRGLLGAYRAAATDPRWSDHLLNGPVTYLAPPGPGGYDGEHIELHDAPHPARPAPAPGDVVPGNDWNLFWSLSFATTAQTWRRIGGFFEGYDGYGGEDTDFARVAKSAGVGLGWVGGARAYHQWHPTSNPPVQHVADIVRNANLFRERWGEWPMVGWLDAFRERGLVAGGVGDERCTVVAGS